MCAKTIRGAIRWHIATELHADYLLLLTEVNGIYRIGARPRHDASIARTLPTPWCNHLVACYSGPFASHRMI